MYTVALTILTYEYLPSSCVLAKLVTRSAPGRFRGHDRQPSYSLGANTSTTPSSWLAAILPELGPALHDSDSRSRSALQQQRRVGVFPGELDWGSPRADTCPRRTYNSLR